MDSPSFDGLPPKSYPDLPTETYQKKRLLARTREINRNIGHVPKAAIRKSKASEGIWANLICFVVQSAVNCPRFQ